jgi:hypothetical protein
VKGQIYLIGVIWETAELNVYKKQRIDFISVMWKMADIFYGCDVGNGLIFWGKMWEMVGLFYGCNVGNGGLIYLCDMGNSGLILWV